ncbi:hypothetical protein GA707_14840 [Nostocoides sp. F2B08]|nr:hypothetical protein GA707_14840 [Tetrasphaera sp. F2B08]
MRHLVVRLVVFTLTLGGFLVFVPSASHAEPVCQVTDPETGICLITVEVPGTPPNAGGGGDDGPQDTGSGVACFWDGPARGIANPPSGPVPCSNERGYWSNQHQCYVALANPQPPPGDAFWEGEYADYGAVYTCYQPQTGQLVLIWAPDPPPNSGAGPTPREVAEMAVEQMNLRAIDIGITPEPGEGSVGIVGMPVWMWAANADSHTVGPITASASAGGITVTATAEVLRITWDMGDGTVVQCATAGTPYTAAYGKSKSPDCGHVYERSSSTKPGAKYTVSATSSWVVTWAGAGQTGTIRMDGLTRSVAIAVGEAQVLVQ